ncbi:hypothetical protein C6W10_29440 [Plantactinospora sp. BB1]|nr:hypothetical protein C6W10_29440 [Plantactinospora sp. BB1]
MSTYPPPGYGPGEPPHDPRQSGQPGGYGGPAGGGSGYPPPSQGGYPQSPSSGGPYGQPPSSGGPYGQSPSSGNPYGQSESYPQSGGYQQSGGYPSTPSSPAGPAAQFDAPVPPPKKSKAPLVIGIVLGVVLLCCGGGIASYLWAGDDEPSNVAASDETPSPTASAKATPPKGKPSPTPGEESIEGNLDQFKKGDCLTIDEATDEVDEASCGTKGALKVLLRKDGTIKESACESTDYTQYLYQDGAIGTLEDFILCVAPAR